MRTSISRSMIPKSAKRFSEKIMLKQRDAPKKAETLRQMIGREAKLAGFDAVAVTAPDAIPLAPARLKQFVAEGFHGSMGWIAETLERRADPRALWPEVR